LGPKGLDDGFVRDSNADHAASHLPDILRRLPQRPVRDSGRATAHAQGRNTAGALGALFTLIREANSAIDDSRILAGDAEGIRTAVMKVDPVLDLYPKQREILDAESESLIAARNAARKTRNFAESDRIRDELVSRGILLEDTPGGTRWRKG